MSHTDIIGASGVSLLLIAFALNLFFKVSKDSFAYIALNLLGSALACFASALLVYWPFILLEGVWAAFSALALWRYFSRPGQAKE